MTIAAELLAHVNAYMVSQQHVLKTAAYKVVQAGQVRVLLQQLPTCEPVELQDAPALVDELDAGPWDEQSKELIAGAINKLATTSFPKSLVSTADRKSQNCSFIEHYLSDAHWAAILDPSKHREERYIAASNMFEAIKMPCPSPRVKQRMIAILASGDPWMQHKENAKKALDSLGRVIRSRRGKPNPEEPHVLWFPDDPSDMDGKFPGYMESVYAEGPPSIEPPMTSDDINALLDGRCLRGTHKSVRGATVDYRRRPCRSRTWVAATAMRTQARAICKG